VPNTSESCNKKEKKNCYCLRRALSIHDNMKASEKKNNQERKIKGRKTERDTERK
jgi:hypothetical protein